jgi:hypothetical protein
MVIKKGIYDPKKLVVSIVSNEEELVPEFDKQIYVDGCVSILISYEDIDFYSYDEIKYNKYYYHPNVDIRYDTDYRTNDFMKLFGISAFFDSIFQVKNSISFKQNGEWFSFTTNSEYVIQVILDGNHKHARLFLKDDTDYFYRFKRGKVKYKKINNIFLPKPDVISYELLDYFLFEGYDFYEDDTTFDISKSKDEIRKVLVGLEYYFVGTSIYDTARDIDIYTTDKDFNEVSQRLHDSGFEKIERVAGHFGHMFKDKYTNAKIDLVRSPYEDFIEPIKDNNADPLLMYFIQVNYYTSICKDNLSDLFKMWRFNKLLETAHKLGISDKRNSFYKNTYIEPARFQKYYDVFSHPEADEVIEDPDNSSIKYSSVDKDGYRYVAIKSKYGSQLVKFELPYIIKDFTIIDDGGTAEITIKLNDDNTSFRLRFIQDYILLKFKIDE